MKEADLVLVDDNFAIRNIIRAYTGTLAKRKGLKLNIYSHSNAASGFADIFQKDADILIVDTTLPKYSTEEIIAFIKDKSNTKKSAKVILITQESINEKVPRGYKVLEKSNFTFLIDLLETIAKSLNLAFSYKGSSATERFTIHMGNAGLYWANTADKIIASTNKTNFFINLVSYYPILFFVEIILSTLMTLIYITIGRITDATIDRAYQEEKKFRYRYFPVVIGFALSLTLISSQALRVTAPNQELQRKAETQSLEILPVTGDIVIESDYVITIGEIFTLLLPALVVYAITLYTYPDFILFLAEQLQKRSKLSPWGIIYNSETLKPVAYTPVRLYRNDRLYRTTITDNKGRYAFKVDPGTYEILVQDPHYLKYEHTVKVKGLSTIEQDIALEKDKDQYRLLLNIKNVNVLILFIGVFASLAYIFITVSTVGAIILAFYAIQIVIALKIYYPSPWGIVFNSRSQLLVKGAIARLYKDNDNRIIDIDITDESGKFSFRAKEGNYFFKISHPDYKLDKYSESSLLEISNMEEGLVSIERHNNQTSYMHVPLTK